MMRIHRSVSDPDQEYIDQHVARLTQSEIDAYERNRLTAGIEELRTEFPDRDWCSLYAFTWTQWLEQRIKRQAWATQYIHDVHAARLAGAADGLAALRVVAKLAELNRQGRKTARVADLINIYKEEP